MLNKKRRFTPLSSTLPCTLFNRLRDDILQEKLKRGERLTEQEVCKEYGVSRTPVREAFQKLELDGLIEIIPNRGAFIIGLTPEDIEDMYELRKAYETIAVRWAVERITDEELEHLEEAFDIMEFYTGKGDSDKMLGINAQFHQLIYDAAKNRMLAHILNSYQVYTRNTKEGSSYMDRYLHEILEEHRTIFDAVKNRDEEAAVQAMTTHMDNSKLRAGF